MNGPVRGIAATHIQCSECGTRTELEEARPTVVVCPVCEDRGEDPTCVQLVAVVPCQEDGGCHAADHEHGTSMHIIEVDQ